MAMTFDVARLLASIPYMQVNLTQDGQVMLLNAKYPIIGSQTIEGMELYWTS